MSKLQYQGYLNEHRIILKAKSKKPGFASLERILYLVDNGILIRSCQLIQKQETLFSQTKITENVDPAFIGVAYRIPRRRLVGADG